ITFGFKRNSCFPCKAALLADTPKWATNGQLVPGSPDESKRVRLPHPGTNRVQTSPTEYRARSTKPKVTGSNPVGRVPLLPRGRSNGMDPGLDLVAVALGKHVNQCRQE